MRAVGLLFIGFYLLSSNITMLGRVAFILDELEHSQHAAANANLRDECQEKPHFTHFREAKKTAGEYQNVTDRTPRLVPHVSQREFTAQTISLKSQINVETSHSRAPPVQL
jgi:hypothetical protein